MKLSWFTPVLVLFASLGVYSAPQRPVVDTSTFPEVLYPRDGTVWRAGDRHNVTWTTENLPSFFRELTGVIIIAQNNVFLSGYGGKSQPLASNFPILNGRVEIRVPNVIGVEFSVYLLIDDSGNASQFFTILAREEIFTAPPGTTDAIFATRRT